MSQTPVGLSPSVTAKRLEGLRQYGILDTPPEQAFDDLTELAAAICEMPVALVSLVEQDRQWFKSRVGLPISETPIEQSMCAHALNVSELLEIPDTTLDARTKENVLVTGPAAFRFYAGAVLRTPDGIELGTLCVLDTKPRRLAERQRDALLRLSRQVTAQLELRRLINDRDRTLHELRLSNERLEMVQQAGRVGGFEWNVADGRVDFSPSLEKLLNARPGSLGHSLDGLGHIGGAREALAGINRCVAAHETRCAFELHVGDDQGKTRWLAGQAQIEFDDENQPTRVIGALADNTEQRVAGEVRERLLDRERIARTEAERASQMKDEFLATLSHELRTPLNAILGWAQILRDAPGDPDDLADGLATIERNARAQTQIIEDLLDMSRIISGKVVLNVHELDVAQVVQAALASARPAADAKGLRVVTSIDTAAGSISGDAGRLQQVLWNLLSNAVKFTPRGGRIDVAVERTDQTVDIRVTDSGEGIAPEFLPFVFDRFRQADASTTRRHGGLGLGLSIVKQLVELHGGSVRVDSAGKGTGTTFGITLPMMGMAVEQPSQDKRKPRSLAAATGANGALAGVKVLALDDDADARSLVERVLSDHGAKVLVASSAAEAFGIVQAEKPDVFVSDIGMPGEDGISLMRRIRQLPVQQGGAVAAVALTAYARAEDREKAIEAGFQMHMVKPFSAAELIKTVVALAPKPPREAR